MNRVLSKFNKNKWLILLLLAELLLVVILMQVCAQKVSLNSDDSPAYSKDNLIDKIDCASGKLKINNVTVNVPVSDNMSYDVSYVWSPEDTDYPTRPHTAIASYLGKDKSTLYDISIYRDSFIPMDQVTKDQDASTWFESWKESESEHVTQQRRDSNDIHGFYIVSITGDSDDSSEDDQYETASYYFAVNDNQGIMVYVLEGILYDPESLDEFTGIMDNCIDSIKIKQQTKSSPAAKSTDSTDGTNATAT